MGSTRSVSPLVIIFLVGLAVAAFAPARSTIPQEEADAIRARFGISPAAVVVFHSPG
jgi:hypothetical protein